MKSEDVLVDLPALERMSHFTTLTHVGRPGTDFYLAVSGVPGSSSAESPTLKHSLDRVFFKSVPPPPPLPPFSGLCAAEPDLRGRVSPGPCLLQDSRSKVYNFDSDLAVLPIPSSNGEPVRLRCQTADIQLPAAVSHSDSPFISLDSLPLTPAPLATRPHPMRSFPPSRRSGSLLGTGDRST